MDANAQAGPRGIVLREAHMEKALDGMGMCGILLDVSKVDEPSLGGPTYLYRYCGQDLPCPQHWTPLVRNVASEAKRVAVNLKNYHPHPDQAATYLARLQAAASAWEMALGMAVYDIEGELTYVAPNAGIHGREWLKANWDSIAC